MTSTDVATRDDSEWDDTGLEDFDSTRISMPRLSIAHPDGTFVNSQTTETFRTLRGVALGMIKQRAMFHAEMGKEKLHPQCKSSDASVGYPTMKGNEKDLFPWADVDFKPDDLAKDEYGRPTIACATCPFSQWSRDKKPPRCSERHAYPILFSDAEDWKPGDDMPHRGIVTFQKSGIKPSSQFLTAFKTSKMPVYSQYAEFSLNREKRGMVTYSVPMFRRLGLTEKDDWQDYSNDYRGVREFLRQPPRPPESEDGDSSTGTPASSVVESTASVASTAPVADPWAPDDDELPF